MRKYLRDIRKKLRLSQQSVAEKLGITSQYYSLIENGDRQQKMSIDFLVKLSDIFQVPLAELIEMERRCTDGEGNDACGDGECVPGAVPEVRRPAV